MVVFFLWFGFSYCPRYLSDFDGNCFAFAGEAASLETHFRQLAKALDTSDFHLQQTENVIRSRTPTGPELDASYMGYVSSLQTWILKWSVTDEAAVKCLQYSMTCTLLSGSCRCY